MARRLREILLDVADKYVLMASTGLRIPVALDIKRRLFFL